MRPMQPFSGEIFLPAPILCQTDFNPASAMNLLGTFDPGSYQFILIDDMDVPSQIYSQDVQPYEQHVIDIIDTGGLSCP